MKAYLIRHGLDVDAKNDLVQRIDAPLVKDAISENNYKNIKFDKVYCSPQLRTRQTADILFENFEIVDYIYEYLLPKEQYGKPAGELDKFWKENREKYTTNPDWSYGGGESFNQIVNRVAKFYKFLKNLKYKQIAVVGHGTFFKHLLSLHSLGRKNYTIDKFYNLTVYIGQQNLQSIKMEL